ncbi:precorrin-4 C(11)-methyltransferase [Effusibacillus dendaii]|uniref:Cobalt-precorrin-4 C(11)-methyltransferase n=1 Tax=Effusibacillus dendaii TaxID=2743772 RepID=A0A7I8DC59_9BACL|nr:precorrin-4 C(11)-methyltransferase [Effusibacillus dendaii]BCJ86100.1 cobalt-precorrin-4 C(11)-methyltransferase [Effusibacillus dendaii]
MAGKVYIIGAGPGDPELITVKGKRLIGEADLILYTDSLVSDEVVADVKPGAVVEKSAGLALEEIVQRMVEVTKAGGTVARVHTGDPAVYGAIMEQIVHLNEAGVEWEIVPGVSSVFAAAAVLGAELTIPELTQTLILTRAEGRTPVPDGEKLADLAKHGATIALFLSATLMEKVVSELRAAGWSDDTPVAVVQRATWPDQVVVRSTVGEVAADMKRHGIRSHAMVLAGKALDEKLQWSHEHKSKLYDKTFAHRYRRAVKQDGTAVANSGGDR